MGVPLNHPFIDWFSIINHPTIRRPHAGSNSGYPWDVRIAGEIDAYQNNDTYLEKSDGSITDLVRLKSGAAMGFAVAAGIYQELGQVSKQEHIDVHRLAGVVQRLLDSMPKNAKKQT